MVQVGKTQRVAEEEDRCVVSDEVPVALLGVKLDRKPTDIAFRVCCATLAGYAGEANKKVGLLANLGEGFRLGIAADVMGDGKGAIGVPGPATVEGLLRFARQFGVVSSAAIVRRYGFSLTNLVQRVGPERFLDRLVAGLQDLNQGNVLFHLYPFGGIADATYWMNNYLSASNHECLWREEGIEGLQSER